MRQIDLFEFSVAQETSLLFAIVLHITCDVPLNRASTYLVNQSFAKMSKECIQAPIKLEPFFKWNLLYDCFILSEVILIAL